MNLEQFAIEAGVTIERCGKEWGGTWAFKCADNPSATYCGYSSKSAAYSAWLDSSVGEQLARTLRKLLKGV